MISSIECFQLKTTQSINRLARSETNGEPNGNGMMQKGKGMKSAEGKKNKIPFRPESCAAVAYRLAPRRSLIGWWMFPFDTASESQRWILIGRFGHRDWFAVLKVARKKNERLRFWISGFDTTSESQSCILIGRVFFSNRSVRRQRRAVWKAARPLQARPAGHFARPAGPARRVSCPGVTTPLLTPQTTPPFGVATHYRWFSIDFFSRLSISIRRLLFFMETIYGMENEAKLSIERWIFFSSSLIRSFSLWVFSLMAKAVGVRQGPVTRWNESILNEFHCVADSASSAPSCRTATSRTASTSCPRRCATPPTTPASTSTALAG